MMPMLQVIAAGLLGLAAGVLVNYLSDVLPGRGSLTQPVCPACQRSMGWQEYLLWSLPGGKACPECDRRRGWRGWLTPLLLTGGFIWIVLAPPARLGIVAGCFWLVYLLLVVVIDLEHHLILHVVTGFGATIAMITGSSMHGWVETVIGGAAAMGVMLLFYWLGIAYARWSTRRRGMPVEEGDALGFGDVTFSGVIGLLLGWPGVVAGLIFGVLFAGAASLLALIPMAIRRQYDPNLAFPYGPFLAAATFYLLYWQ